MWVGCRVISPIFILQRSRFLPWGMIFTFTTQECWGPGWYIFWLKFLHFEHFWLKKVLYRVLDSQDIINSSTMVRNLVGLPWQIMRFCQSFMEELYRHIGPNQVPLFVRPFSLSHS
jgi:hypothetical protein